MEDVILNNLDIILVQVGICLGFFQFGFFALVFILFDEVFNRIDLKFFRGKKHE